MKNEPAHVLVAWAGSYIGRRLTRKLLERTDVRLTLLVQDARRISEFSRHPLEIVEGDALNDEILRKALQGVEVAYFPFRLLGTDKEFGAQTRTFATSSPNAVGQCDQIDFSI